MRALALAALLTATPAAVRAADADPLAAETLAVKDVPGPLAADPAAPFWDAQPALDVLAAPQRTVRLHDARANQALAAAGPLAVKVRAATDGKDLAVLLEWPDATEDRARDATDAYGDAAALQLPQRFGPGQRLPYVGMGDPAQPVALYLQRAGPDGQRLILAREAVAAGFGSTTRADLGDARFGMRWAAGRWRAVFVRPLTAPASDLARGLVPFAVAVWDGGRAERGGNKALSGWKLLRVERLPADPAYQAELAVGHRPEDRGDLARGKQLVQGMCSACHLMPERRIARPGIAPDLSAVGVIATPAYLRESIVAPSAIVVPSPNPAQHQDRSKPAGVTDAVPRAEGFVWSRVDAAGKPVSKMPAYAALPPADLNAMVTYLMTLGRTP
jgi:complex iron-sulfur molybdoenzyme family reductase subunit gamma